MAEAIKGSGRQVAWVIDLNRCIGCQTCSVACKVLWTQGEGEGPMWWCTVNTKPGLGTPRDWEQMGGGYDNGKLVLGQLPTAEEFGEEWEFNHADVYSSGKGNASFLRPVGDPKWGMNWDEDIGAGEYPNAHFFYLPRLCNHCSRPACVEACEKGALHKREIDGLVLRDEERCEGDQNCARACPYKKIYFNEARKVSQHCIGCFPRLEKGVAPACVRQCPGRAVFFGFLDDGHSTVWRFVKDWEVALPLHAEMGTEPNVFYIPPLAALWIKEDGSVDESRRRLPTDYLEALFGHGVHSALHTLEEEIEKRRQGRPSELMDTLIAYDWKELLGPFTRDPAELTWT